MHHGGEDEGELTSSEGEGVAILHFDFSSADVVESAEHSEGLLVAHHLDVGIVFAYQCDRPTVVGFHVVDDEVVDGAVADDLVDILYELCEEVHLDGVDEAHFLIHDEV